MNAPPINFAADALPWDDDEACIECGDSLDADDIDLCYSCALTHHVGCAN